MRERDTMFAKTSFVYVSWCVPHSDNKKTSRINIVKHFLSQNDYPEKDKKLLVFEHGVIRRFDPTCYKQKLIA